MKNLLPIGSVVLLKDATKKLVIIGILQVNPSENKIYDYLGVPYPEGYGERRGHRCRQAGDPENVFHSDHCVCGTNIWDLSGTLR